MPRLCTGTLVALLAISLSGCSNDSDEPWSLLTSGKGDQADPYGLTECERNSLLDFVNDCENGDEALRIRGLRSNMRDALIATRAVNCDSEERTFNIIQDVRDIHGIGPTTITNLGKSFTELCASQPTTSDTAQVFFSPRIKDNSHLPQLVKLIDAARDTIDVAIYSFSDNDVIEALERAIADRGVSVRLIYHKAYNNPTNSESVKMENKGIDVRYVQSSKTMHHKFMIIDGPKTDLAAAATATVATGSANWSSSAATIYDENTITLTGFPSVAKAFQHEFNTIWDRSGDFVHGDPKPYEPSPMLLDEHLTTNPNAEVLFTMGNFKPDNSFGRIRGNYVIANRIADEISNANNYVYIASGHMRSKPIYDALFKLKKTKPHVDVRIYLDGQEYTRDNEENQENRNLCLASAGNSAGATEDCYLRGWKYAYSLHTADTNDDGQGGDLKVRLKYYAYKWKHSYPQMHHKYVLIDDTTLITGSCNLSHNAEVGSFENSVILRASDPTFVPLIAAFKANFNEIWDTDKEKVLHTKLIDEIKNGTSKVPLVFKPMSLDVDTIRKLKSTIYGMYNSVGKKQVLFNCTSADRGSCTRP